MMQVLRWAGQLLDFCYPGVCAGCEAPCEGSARLCDECDKQLDQLASANACALCGMPVQEPQAPCPFCGDKGVPHFDHIVRLGVFEDPLKHLIHQIKYHGRWGLADFLADRLFATAGARQLLEQCDRLVAVPLHPLRHIWRGFNQAQLIARRLSRCAGIKLVRPIVRLRNTQTQTLLHSQEKRTENVRDAFGLINPRCIRDRHIVVVDDVTTTGATLQSVARILQQARPKCLSAIVLAVADPKHQSFQSL